MKHRRDTHGGVDGELGQDTVADEPCPAVAADPQLRL